MIGKETAEDGGKLGVLHVFRISNIPRDYYKRKISNKFFEKEVNYMCIEFRTFFLTT